ncbi:MAG: hypothetical protein KAQ75_03145, partial [Bacteroidales bacterium]|nr:hypothetical protein [Bacteroidales bacterium]
FNSNEVFVVKEGSLQKKIINVIKVNEKTLIFDGLKEGEMMVMQPLINVLEGTLVEILGQQKEGKPSKKGTKSKKD